MKGKVLGSLLGSDFFAEKKIAYITYSENPRGEKRLQIDCYDPSEHYELKKE